MGKIKRLILP